jgi:hypothetical protein
MDDSKPQDQAADNSTAERASGGGSQSGYLIATGKGSYVCRVGDQDYTDFTAENYEDGAACSI